MLEEIILLTGAMESRAGWRAFGVRAQDPGRRARCKRSANESARFCKPSAIASPPNTPEQPRAPSPACHTGRCFSPAFAVLRGW